MSFPVSLLPRPKIVRAPHLKLTTEARRHGESSFLKSRIPHSGRGIPIAIDALTELASNVFLKEIGIFSLRFEISEKTLSPCLRASVVKYDAENATQFSSYTVKLHLLDDRRLAILVESPV
jgi:hypothetical protein